MNRILIATLSSNGLLALSQSTNANPNTEAAADRRQMAISYSDLNIHSEAGARALLGRLKMAARVVCGPEPVFGELQRTEAYETCRLSALDHAVAAIDSPELAEIYRGEFPTSRTARN